MAMHKVTRRAFVKAGAAAAVGAATAIGGGRVLGANERVRLGFIGVGNRGGQLLERTLPLENAEVVALCDVYQPFLDEWAEKSGNTAATYTDFRRILERDDVDAVVIASPDHWHAVQTIMACDAGKDVFVEKPLSLTIVEGRKMVEAARRNERVVTVGLHRRASANFMRLREELNNGAAGKITVSRAYRLSNMAPSGMGKAVDGAPPPGLDWDMWLGPRPERPFRDNIAPYKFRWWAAYSSQMTNWGVHYFDTLRWLLGEEHITSTSVHGGIYAVDDDRSIPDTMHAIFEFPGKSLMLFGQYEANGHPAFSRHAEFELRGTRGTVFGSGRGFEIVPERGGQFQDPAPRMEPVEVKSEDGDLTTQHIQNFLDCVKSRERPYCDVEDGHKSTLIAHLGNIALATESRIVWDPAAERIVNNEDANELLHYEYRAPWRLDG
jgi:predicted dehydrogenase